MQVIMNYDTCLEFLPGNMKKHAVCMGYFKTLVHDHPFPHHPPNLPKNNSRIPNPQSLRTKPIHMTSTAPRPSNHPTHRSTPSPAPSPLSLQLRHESTFARPPASSTSR
ncbi:hypothetical protein N7G274_000573 [Stereocaulon virgatum]|uniref:Uncharacterized protein n=1 Tax=Stereocaulon virgatum TaxID=373712 RepID=A0ABR4AVB2_9LECA